MALYVSAKPQIFCGASLNLPFNSHEVGRWKL